jgi:hypothetical protein
MKTIKDLSGYLIGKVSPQERFFRVMVQYMIINGNSSILFSETKFMEYIFSIEGDDTEMYWFLVHRHQEFMSNVEDLVLGRLTKTGN